MGAEERLADPGVALVVDLMQSHPCLAGGRVEADRDRDQSETQISFPSCTSHVCTPPGARHSSSSKPLHRSYRATRPQTAFCKATTEAPDSRPAAFVPLI